MKTSKRIRKNSGSEKEKPRSNRETGLEDLLHEELSGTDAGKSSLAVSSTDEDEDEGLGDGNIGRSKNNILSKE
jgi:hypothetical protein